MGTVVIAISATVSTKRGLGASPVGALLVGVHVVDVQAGDVAHVVDAPIGDVDFVSVATNGDIVVGAKPIPSSFSSKRSFAHVARSTTHSPKGTCPLPCAKSSLMEVYVAMSSMGHSTFAHILIDMDISSPLPEDVVLMGGLVAVRAEEARERRSDGGRVAHQWRPGRAPVVEGGAAEASGGGGAKTGGEGQGGGRMVDGGGGAAEAASGGGARNDGQGVERWPGSGALWWLGSAAGSGGGEAGRGPGAAVAAIGRRGSRRPVPAGSHGGQRGPKNCRRRCMGPATCKILACMP
ncbi:uncharacterized protein LOC131056883 [Cryptomeria japonica]|uniref:uncharacterized protein LOC131056883 n=1 Tax=Cryptomeria japonica TaxID=3369 RepID=UPI0027DAADEB|nr:uncharacterized protein LOC131056883 [Cryptomeria japonica]